MAQHDELVSQRCCDWYERAESARTAKALYAALERIPCDSCNRHVAASEVPEPLRPTWEAYVKQSSPRRMPRALGFWLFRHPNGVLAHS